MPLRGRRSWSGSVARRRGSPGGPGPPAAYGEAWAWGRVARALRIGPLHVPADPGQVAEDPEPLAVGRLDHVVVAADVGPAPPPGLDALRAPGPLDGVLAVV